VDSEVIIRALVARVRELELKDAATGAILRQIKEGTFDLDRLELVGENQIALRPAIRALPDAG
jgi:hypothetical protein